MAGSVSLVQIPISGATNDANDGGSPLTISRPKEAAKELAAFRDLAAIVSRELLQLQYGSSTEGREIVAFEPDRIKFDVATVTVLLDKSKGGEPFSVVSFPSPRPSNYLSRPRNFDCGTRKLEIRCRTVPILLTKLHRKRCRCVIISSAVAVVFACCCG